MQGVRAISETEDIISNDETERQGIFSRDRQPQGAAKQPYFWLVKPKL